MTGKAIKTKNELEAIVMDRIRKNIDWIAIKDAVVTPLQRTAPHQPNWDAAFIVDGAALRPADAQHLITSLQNEYDLIDG
jgi:hypothetical protein